LILGGMVFCNHESMFFSGESTLERFS